MIPVFLRAAVVASSAWQRPQAYETTVELVNTRHLDACQDEAHDVDLSEHEDDLDTLEFSLLQTSLTLDAAVLSMQDAAADRQIIEQLGSLKEASLPRLENASSANDSNFLVDTSPQGRAETHRLQAEAGLSTATPTASDSFWTSFCHSGLGYWLCEHSRGRGHGGSSSTRTFFSRALEKAMEIRLNSGVPPQVFMFFGFLVSTVAVFSMVVALQASRSRKALTSSGTGHNVSRDVKAAFGMRNPLALLFDGYTRMAEAQSSLLPNVVCDHKTASLNDAAASLHAAASLSAALDEMEPDESQPSFPVPAPLLQIGGTGTCDGIRPLPRPAPWDTKAATPEVSAVADSRSISDSVNGNGSAMTSPPRAGGVGLAALQLPSFSDT